MASKQVIINALREFISKRPQLDFNDYADCSIYRAESRSITKDLNNARTLLRAVELRSSITAQEILDASKRAFMGRLNIIENGDSVEIDYCTGQYFPTEYRKAVAAIMASVLWDFWRTDATNGQHISVCARKEFGRAIALRYFN